METVINIYFSNICFKRKAVIVSVSFQLNLIKGNIFIIKLRHIGVYVEEVLVTIDTTIDIGIVKTPDIFCKEADIGIHLTCCNHETEFFLAQIYRVWLY